MDDLKIRERSMLNCLSVDFSTPKCCLRLDFRWNLTFDPENFFISGTPRTWSYFLIQLLSISPQWSPLLGHWRLFRPSVVMQWIGEDSLWCVPDRFCSGSAEKSSLGRKLKKITENAEKVMPQTYNFKLTKLKKYAFPVTRNAGSVLTRTSSSRPCCWFCWYCRFCRFFTSIRRVILRDSNSQHHWASDCERNTHGQGQIAYPCSHLNFSSFRITFKNVTLGKNALSNSH